MACAELAWVLVEVETLGFVERKPAWVSFDRALGVGHREAGSLGIQMDWRRSCPGTLSGLEAVMDDTLLAEE